MARKLVIALVVLAALAGGAAFVLRKQLVATPPAPPELARVADPTSQRTLPGGGDVVGYTGRYGSHVWLGIPYAEPPVGERRWRAPAPPAAWSGTREALAFGPHCPQFASAFGGVDDVPAGAISGSEDCLYLNVYAPRMQPGAVAQAKLPVMVWIHGGSNVVGLADFYDGGRLAQTPGSHRGHAEFPARSLRLVPPRGVARRRDARRAVGQLRDARSRARARVGARQRGRLRRRSRKRDDLRRVGGRHRTSSRCCSRRSRRDSSSEPSRESGGTETTPPAEGENFRDDSGARAPQLVERGAGAAPRRARARRAIRSRPERRSRRCRRRRS